MTIYTKRSRLFKYHVANIRSIEIAIKNTAVSARRAIAEEKQQARDSFVRLYAFLLGAWAETRLKKLLYEPKGFQEAERHAILSQLTKLESWQKAVEVAFRKQYNVPSAALTEHTLPFTAFAYYSVISAILDKDLRSVIEIRNKLAHGQWIYPLNNEGSEVETKKFKQLRNENLPSLQYKLRLISSIANIIHDLIVSIATFERDFDTHYRHITTTRNNLEKRKYSEYADKLIEKRKRGIEKRKKSKA